MGDHVVMEESVRAFAYISRGLCFFTGHDQKSREFLLSKGFAIEDVNKKLGLVKLEYPPGWYTRQSTSDKRRFYLFDPSDVVCMEFFIKHNFYDFCASTSIYTDANEYFLSDLGPKVEMVPNPNSSIPTYIAAFMTKN